MNTYADLREVQQAQQLGLIARTATRQIKNKQAADLNRWLASLASEDVKS